MMSRKQRIENQLTQDCSPSYLMVEDESKNHHVPQGAESHFKIIVVSSAVEGLTRIARHKKINQILNQEFEQGMHALSMHLYTAEEWAGKKDVAPSPSCKDGFDKH